jgi:hypothetical protein
MRCIPPSVLPDISPSRGEIGWGARSPSIIVKPAVSDFTLGLDACRLLIFPLEGEMPGRAEGGSPSPPSARSGAWSSLGYLGPNSSANIPGVIGVITL